MATLCRIKSKARASSRPLLIYCVKLAKHGYCHGDRPRLVDLN